MLELIGLVAEALPQLSEAVFLSFVSGTGLVALKGALTRERGALRFRVQDEGCEKIDARRYTRVDAELKVSLLRADADKGWAGTTVNIAQEARPRAPSSRPRWTMPSPSRCGCRRSSPLAAQAKVVRHGGDRSALHFVDVGPFEQAAIAEFGDPDAPVRASGHRPVALRRPGVGVGEEVTREHPPTARPG